MRGRFLDTVALLFAAWMIGGCDPSLLGGGANDNESFHRLFILGVDGLEEPAVAAGERVYKPRRFLPIGGDKSDSSTYTGFRIHVAAAAADRVQVRLVNTSRPGNAVGLLLRVASPGSQDGLPAPFDEHTRELLRDGGGVFWTTEAGAGSSVLDVTVHVLLPGELITPFSMLELYTDETDAGDPVGEDSFFVVPGYFYMAVLGDSVQWGNGLTESTKFRTLVARTIEEETGRHVVMQVFAHSGARIVPEEGDAVCRTNCWGEVPIVRTSINLQAELIEQPGLIDFVLMDGCINDIHLSTITDPETDPADLEAVTRHFCGEEMTSLLRKVRLLAPQASVVVTGYYPMVGEESDLFGLGEFFTLRGIESTGELNELRSVLASHASLFDGVSRESLAGAVETVNAESNGPPAIAFAAVDWASSHSLFSSDSWLWNMGTDSRLIDLLDVRVALVPEDPVIARRVEACGEEDILASILGCLYSSVGHPNPTGAAAYAAAIEEQLRVLRVLPRE